jgi:uncharacterized coiled-coil protein SlyX
MEKSETEQESLSAEEISLLYPDQLQSKEANENFEKTLAEVEKRFTELLTTISEETIQLGELLVEEKKLIQELCTLLRHILKRLDMTFNLSLKAIPELQPKAKRIMLNKEGRLIVMYEKDKVSKVLEDYPPEIVLSVIWNVIPELEKSMRAHRKKISERIRMFEKIKKELKNIQKVFSSSNRDESEVLIAGNEELKSRTATNENQPTHPEKTE